MLSTDSDEYNDSHRALLQAFLARNTLTFETSKPLLAAIRSVSEKTGVDPDDITIEVLNSYISVVNSVLSPLDLEIRSTFHQQSRERVYAVVNTTSDSLTQLATTYTADEIAYVKRLLDGMFDGRNNRGRTEAMCVSGIEAIQFGRASARRDTQNGTPQAASQGLSFRDAENVLARLTDEGWLEKSSRGYYSLSPRSLMELKGWLIDTYNDNEDGEEDPQPKKIKFCHACKEIITVVCIS
jgi:non-structural maintenance of chromosomes element 1